MGNKFYDLLETGAIVLFKDGETGVVLGNSIALYDSSSSKPDYIFSIMDEHTHKPFRPLFGPGASSGYRIIAIYCVPLDLTKKYIDEIFRGGCPVIGPQYLVYDEDREYCKDVTMADIEEKFGCKVHIVEEET